MHPMRYSVALSVVALAACANQTSPDRSASTGATLPLVAAPAAPTIRAGTGVVQSVSAESPASEGASKPGFTVDPIQLTLRMDDGSMQTVWHDNANFRVGDRVQVTSDAKVVRP